MECGSFSNAKFSGIASYLGFLISDLKMKKIGCLKKHKSLGMVQLFVLPFFSYILCLLCPYLVCNLLLSQIVMLSRHNTTFVQSKITRPWQLLLWPLYIYVGRQQSPCWHWQQTTHHLSSASKSWPKKLSLSLPVIRYPAKDKE